MYTLEHFEAVKNRLAAGGLFCQWLPLHQLDEATLRVIVRTFLEVFPNCRAYLLHFNVDTPVLGVVGRLEPAFFSAEWFDARLSDARLEDRLKPLGLQSASRILGCLVATQSALESFATGASLNRDHHPVVMFNAPAFAYRQNPTPYGRLLNLLERGGADPEALFARQAFDDGGRVECAVRRCSGHRRRDAEAGETAVGVCLLFSGLGDRRWSSAPISRRSSVTNR